MGRTSLLSPPSVAAIVEPVIKWRVGGSESPPYELNAVLVYGPALKQNPCACEIKEGKSLYPSFAPSLSPLSSDLKGAGVAVLERALSVQASQSVLCLQVQRRDPSEPHKQTQAV